MSVRVVARIRPLLKAEIEKDIIVEAAGGTAEAKGGSKSIVRIPNPKNESESFSFQFNSVYDQEATQAQLFDNEGETSKRVKWRILWANAMQSHPLSSTCSRAAMSPSSPMVSRGRARHIRCVAASHWQTEV
jgi:hypothetical protein